jgi:hypothetical protein
MGMVIPNQNDLQISAQLNRAFGPGNGNIDQLRRHYAIEQVFDGNHSLERVVFRISAVPNNATARGRWFGLLHTIDTDPALQQTRDAIKHELHTALINRVVPQLTFTAQLDQTQATHGVRIGPDPNVANATLLTLLCPADPYNGFVRPPNWQPPADNNEQPPIIIWP